MTLLLALLAISYVGSMLIRGRALRGYGLPSGSEWVLFGFVIGPHGLGVVKPEMLRAFDPIAAVAVGWLSLLIGVSIASQRRAGTLRAPITGAVIALLSAAVVALAVFFTAGGFSALSERDLWLIAGGVGLVSCETTQHAVEWVVQRYAARGPLSAFVARMADFDDFVPLLLIALPFAFAPSQVPIEVAWWIWVCAPLVLGVLLGGTCAVLLNFEKHASRGWGVVLGAALLTSGIAWRIGVSPLTAMLVLGASVASFSRHRAGLQSMLERTEHPVLLPTLLLAGASIQLESSPLLMLTLMVACAGRVAVRLAASRWVARVSGARPRPGLSLGLGLLPTGAVTMMIGLSFALRFPAQVGPIVLCAAAVQTLVGEVLGTVSLRRALQQAEEIPLPEAVESETAAELSEAQR
jgi:hypothetical protein